MSKYNYQIDVDKIYKQKAEKYQQKIINLLNQHYEQKAGKYQQKINNLLNQQYK